MSITQGDDGLYHVPIVQLGQRLRDNFGLRIREHSAFGDGSIGKHAPNSYHKYDEAIDVTDHRPDVIDGVDWTTRTGNLQNLLKGSGAEIIGPNSGDPGHSTHLHLAAKGGLFKLNQQQYDTLFGGKQKDILKGGAGTDTFRLSKGKDTIEDFSISDGDVIDAPNKLNLQLIQQGEHLLLKDNDHNIKTTILNINQDDLLQHQPDLI